MQDPARSTSEGSKRKVLRRLVYFVKGIVSLNCFWRRPVCQAAHSLEGPYHPSGISWTVPHCPISGTCMQLSSIECPHPSSGLYKAIIFSSLFCN